MTVAVENSAGDSVEQRLVPQTAVVESPTTTAPVATSSEPQSATTTSKPSSPSSPSNTGLLIGTQISLLECLFVLMEFIFGGSILTGIWRFPLHFIMPLFLNAASAEVLYSILGQLSITLWVLARLSWNLKTTFRHVIDILRDGLRIFQQHDRSSLVPAMVIIQIVSLLGMTAYQLCSKNWIYSWENFYITPPAIISDALSNTADELIPDNFEAAFDQVNELLTAQAEAVSNAVVEGLHSESITDDVIGLVSTASADLIEPVFSYLRLFQFVILGPILEEIIFRCAMLPYVHMRLAKYFPGRPQPSLAGVKAANKDKKKKTKKAAVAAATATATANTIIPAPDADDEMTTQEQTESSQPVIEATPVDETKVTASKKRSKTSNVELPPLVLPRVTVAQLSSIIAGVAFGSIHIINLMNGNSYSYVALQVILGSLMGIVLNAVSYMHGPRAALILHIVNNISASVISAKIDILSNWLFIFGFFETVVCYSIFAYIALKSLQIPNATFEIAKLPPNCLPNAHTQNVLPYFSTFNNKIIATACTNNNLPASIPNDAKHLSQ